MTTITDSSAQLSGAVVEGPAAAVLEATRQANVAMAVWRRTLPTALAHWLDAVAFDDLPNERMLAPRTEVRGAVEAACARLPADRERAALIEDIAAVAERFCDVARTPQARIRLDAVDDDACRRFHQDAIAARLLCTYRGPATEWGRAARGGAPDEINRLARGDVAILKGAQERSGLAHDLVHRSPPIEGTGAARFLLVIDPIDWSDDAGFAAS